MVPESPKPLDKWSDVLSHQPVESSGLYRSEASSSAVYPDVPKNFRLSAIQTEMEKKDDASFDPI